MDAGHHGKPHGHSRLLTFKKVFSWHIKHKWEGAGKDSKMLSIQRRVDIVSAAERQCTQALGTLKSL